MMGCPEKNIVLIIFCGLLFLFGGNGLSAQQDFTGNVYLSLPLSPYSSTSLDKGGFAKTGWGMSFDSKTDLPNLPFGIKLGLHLAYQKHEFSQAELTKVFTRFFQETIGQEYSALISIGYYQPFVMTLGPYYDLDIGENLEIGFRSGLGVMFTNMDPMRFNILDGNNQVIQVETLEFEGEAVFTYFVGTGLFYHFSPDFKVSSLIDFAGGNSKILTSFNTDDQIEANQQILFINLGVGLTWIF